MKLGTSFVYYLPDQKTLAFYGECANEEHWSKRWSKQEIGKMHARHRSNPTLDQRRITQTTKRYLHKNSRVLEGGCGPGDKVLALADNGFDVVGIDYSQELINNIKEINPDLEVFHDDIRHLSFSDSEFDGYWSLGVIEHFQDGYLSIIKEMRRVLKTGGFLFLTVPAISPATKGCIRLGLIKDCPPDVQLSFYQYAYFPNKIIRDFTNESFKLVEYSGIAGGVGLVNLAKFTRPVVAAANKIAPRLFETLSSPFTNHMWRFVFQCTK